MRRASCLSSRLTEHRDPSSRQQGWPRGMRPSSVTRRCGPRRPLRPDHGLRGPVRPRVLTRGPGHLPGRARRDRVGGRGPSDRMSRLPMPPGLRSRSTRAWSVKETPRRILGLRGSAARRAAEPPAHADVRASPRSPPSPANLVPPDAPIRVPGPVRIRAFANVDPRPCQARHLMTLHMSGAGRCGLAARLPPEASDVARTQFAKRHLCSRRAMALVM
jgi:hypothetical protein